MIVKTLERFNNVPQLRSGMVSLRSPWRQKLLHIIPLKPIRKLQILKNKLKISFQKKIKKQIENLISKKNKKQIEK